MLSVLIPVFNEEAILRESVLKVHDYLFHRSLEHEVIVTSNGSTDQTDNIGKELEKEFTWLRFFIVKERGVGIAFVNAVNAARGEYLISLDIDLSSDLKFIEYANDLLRYADLVVGSKTMGRQRRSIIRVVASQLYIMFTQIFFHLTISDYSIGCKAYKRAVVLPTLPHLDSWTGFVFELCVWMNLKGYKIIQVGVDCNDDRKSHFNLLHEGFYRYLHMYRCWRRVRSGCSWFNFLESRQSNN